MKLNKLSFQKLIAEVADLQYLNLSSLVIFKILDYAISLITQNVFSQYENNF